MAGSENRTEEKTVRTVDITPNLPNSPVVDKMKHFLQSVYWYADRTEIDPAFKRYLDVAKKDTIEAMRQILTDDSIILITGKLPSDRDRYIGTKRKPWL